MVNLTANLSLFSKKDRTFAVVNLLLNLNYRYSKLAPSTKISTKIK